jgi:hypothetical protein
LTRTWLAGLCVRLLLGAVLRTVVAAFWITSVSLFAQSNAVYYAATLEHNCCMRTFTLVWLVVGGFLLLSPAYAPACPWWDALVMLRAVGFAMMLCLCGALYLLLKVALRFSPCAVPERVVQFLVACGAYNAAPPPDAPAAEHLMPDDKLPRTAFRGAGAGCGKSEPADACVICTENYREGDDVVVLPCGAQKPPTPGGGGAARGTPPGGEGPPHSGGAGAADAVGVALEVVVVVGGGGGGGGAGAPPPAAAACPAVRPAGGSPPPSPPRALSTPDDAAALVGTLRRVSAPPAADVGAAVALPWELPPPAAAEAPAGARPPFSRPRQHEEEAPAPAPTPQLPGSAPLDGHHFHAHCLKQWLATSSNPTCPVCRSVVPGAVARAPGEREELQRQGTYEQMFSSSLFGRVGLVHQCALHRTSVQEEQRHLVRVLAAPSLRHVRRIAWVQGRGWAVTEGAGPGARGADGEQGGARELRILAPPAPWNPPFAGSLRAIPPEQELILRALVLRAYTSDPEGTFAALDLNAAGDVELSIALLLSIVESTPRPQGGGGGSAPSAPGNAGGGDGGGDGSGGDGGGGGDGSGGGGGEEPGPRPPQA